MKAIQLTGSCGWYSSWICHVLHYTRKSFILVLNCNGSEPDQISDLKTDSGTVLNLMFWARTCFGTYVCICIRLCSYLSQLCKGILNDLCMLLNCITCDENSLKLLECSWNNTCMYTERRNVTGSYKLLVLIVGIQSHLWWGYPKQSSSWEALSHSTTDSLEQHMPAAVLIVATGNELRILYVNDFNQKRYAII